MPHRDPLFAARARCAQLRERVAEIDRRAAGPRVEPRSLAAALAEKERLLRVLQVAEEEAAEERGEELSVTAGSDAVAENAAPNEAQAPPPTKLVLALALGVLVVTLGALVFVLYEFNRTVAVEASDRIDTYFAAVVESRTGEINARVGDRCEVVLRLASEGECRLDVTCPGVERRTSSPSCPMPGEGARLEAHWPGIDFDGEQLSFVDTDEQGHERGRATARAYPWFR